MTGRNVCPACKGQTLTVRVLGRPVVCDWPWTPAGGVAATHRVSGAWDGRYSAPGEPLHPGEQRFQLHQCEQPPSITEPRVPAQLPPERVERWKQVVAARNAEKRNRRGRRPPKPITGIRPSPR